MRASRDVAREVSYASSAQSKGGRVIIRLMENATGRLNLIRRARGYEQEVAGGRDFWEVIVERYGLSLDVIGGGLSNIPASGPLVLIANHPYGILDGLMMGHILSVVRGEDFRILANRVFRRAEDLNRIILPVNFDETKDAIRQNIETRRVAHDYLRAGGAIGIFPGGTVSTAPKPFARPMDPAWRTFTAKLIAKSGATVVPVFFAGHNSRRFQVASHLHVTLRMALMINEFRMRLDDTVKVVIGEPIERARLDVHARDPKAMMDFLRAETYALSPDRLESFGYGYEFEVRRRA